MPAWLVVPARICGPVCTDVASSAPWLLPEDAFQSARTANTENGWACVKSVAVLNACVEDSRKSTVGFPFNALFAAVKVGATLNVDRAETPPL
jgi:hypothetical protein